MEIIGQAPAPTPEHLAQIAQAEAAACAAIAEREASFQRCDTDGFLSQWANGLVGERERLQVEILRNGGNALFLALARGDEIVSEHRVDRSVPGAEWATREVWVLPPAWRPVLGRTVIPTGERSRIQKQLGLREVRVWRPAVAKIVGRGHGLSGSAWVEAVKVRP